MPYESELDAALNAAATASRIILEHYAERTAIPDAAASITTATDRASQDAIIQSLAARFPNDAFRAEEATPALAAQTQRASRVWIIDPIDGTRGFARKNDQFSVMIALAENGVVVVGVVDEPALGRCTYATRGGGCFRRDKDGAVERVAASSSTSLEKLTLTQSHTNSTRGPSAAVRRLRPTQVLETYSAGIKLAHVARGEADLYVCEYDAMNDWDIAAGHVLVTEAGGRVSTNDGRDLIFARESPLQTGGLLATNGRIHELVIEALGV